MNSLQIGASRIKEFLQTPILLKMELQEDKKISTPATRAGIAIHEEFHETIKNLYKNVEFEKQFFSSTKHFRATLDACTKDRGIEVKTLNKWRFKEAQSIEWCLEEFGAQMQLQKLLSGVENTTLIVIDRDTFSYLVHEIDLPQWYSLSQLEVLYDIFEKIDTRKVIRTDPYFKELAKTYGFYKDLEKTAKEGISKWGDKIKAAQTFGFQKVITDNGTLSITSIKGRPSMSRYEPIKEMWANLSQLEKDKTRGEETTIIRWTKKKEKKDEK